MLRRLLPYLLILLALASLKTNALADPSHLGTGFWVGNSCPGGGSCSPDPHVQSPQINVSIPYGNGQYGYATLPAGWIESCATCDADGWNVDCQHPQNYNGHGYGTVSYNDGTINYSGAAEFNIEYADTSQVSWLSGGAITCWQCQSPYCTSFPPSMYQPKMYFIRKIKIRSCSATTHVPSNRFIATGCDGYVESSFLNDPWCKWLNTNYINLTVSGF